MRTLARRYYYLPILSVLGLIGTAVIFPAAKAQFGVKIERARATGQPRQLHEVKPYEQNVRAERIRHVFSPQRRSCEPAASQLGGVNEQFAHARPQLGLTGVVKWFNPAKGFGFITPDDGSEDVYAHFSALTMNGFQSLKEGTRVSFDVLVGPKGKQASNIQKTGK